jgi:hypothetical protein
MEYWKEAEEASVKKRIKPDVAKAGVIHSQGAKGAAGVICCNPLARPGLDCSGFPARGKT